MKKKNTHHILPGESYRDYMKRNRAEMTAVGKHHFSGRLLLLLCKAGAAATPVLYAGYMAAVRVNSWFSSFVGFCCSLLLAYVLYASVYFIKGYIVCLRRQQNKLWMPLWGICMGFIGLLATLALHQLFVTLLPPGGSMSILYWIISIAFGTGACFSYDLKNGGAPRLVYWSYRLAKNSLSAETAG